MPKNKKTLEQRAFEEASKNNRMITKDNWKALTYGFGEKDFKEMIGKNKMPKPLIKSKIYKQLTGDISVSQKILENQAKYMKKEKFKKMKMPILKLDMSNELLNASASSLHIMTKTEMKEMKRKAKEPCDARELSLTTLHTDGDYASIRSDGEYITIARKNGKVYVFFDSKDEVKFVHCNTFNDKQWKKYFK